MNTLTTLNDIAVRTAGASLRAAAVAALILLVHAVFRRWIPAQWRYGVWFGFLAVLVLPWRPAGPWALDQFRFPHESPPSLNQSPSSDQAGPPLSATASASSAAASVPGETSSAWQSWIGPVWLTGAFAVAGLGFAAWRREMRRLRNDSVPASPALQDEIQAAAADAGVHRLPALLVSRAADGPAVTGLLRPVLVVPSDFCLRGNCSERRLILRHELAHVRRHDAAANWLLWLAQAVHWFNPAVWMAMARIRADRELARDAEVLRTAGPAERADYGTALMRQGIASTVTGFAAAGFAGLAARGSNLRRRLGEIGRHRRVSAGWHAAGPFIAVLLATAGLVEAQKPSPPAAVVEDPAITAVREKAQSLIIPALEFDEATLEEAVGYLRRVSIELDGAAGPSSKGVNFILRNAADARPISFSMKNGSVLEATRAIAEASGLRMTVTPAALAVHAGDWPVHAGKPPGKAQKLAMTWRIGRAAFSNARPDEIASFLEWKSKQADPAGKGITVKAAPGVKPEFITFDLRDATIWEIAQHVGESCGAVLTADDTGLTLSPAPAAEPDAKAAASACKIDRVMFEGATLHDALKFLQAKAGASAPDAPGVRIEAAEGIDIGTAVTLNLAGTDMWAVLTAIADSHGWMLKTGPDFIRIEP